MRLAIARIKQVGAWLWLPLAALVAVLAWLLLRRRPGATDGGAVAAIAQDARLRLAEANVKAAAEVAVARAESASGRIVLNRIATIPDRKVRLERMAELINGLEGKP